MKGLRVRKAQSVLEYVILVTVVVAAVIAVLWVLGIDTGTKAADQTRGLGKLLYRMSDKLKTDSKLIADIAK